MGTLRYGTRSLGVEQSSGEISCEGEGTSVKMVGLGSTRRRAAAWSVAREGRKEMSYLQVTFSTMRCLALALASMAFSFRAAAADSRPSILFILTDDMG